MKNIAYLLLFFLLTSANTTAQANTLAGGSGWRVVSTVSNGIGVTVNGAKDIIVNGAKKTVTGVANVTPTPGQVGKFIGRNTAAAAVVGVVDLLLDGVDWVIDEGGKVNKRPVQDYDSGPVDPIDPTLEYVYKSPYYFTNSAYGSKESLCKAQGSAHANASGIKVTFKNVRSDGISCIYDSDNGLFELPVLTVRNPAYDPLAPLPETVPINDKEGKPLTLTTLGEMVIDQAETEVKTGNPAVPIATPVTQAAASAAVAEAETDDVQARPIVQELEKNPSYPTTEEGEGTITQPEVVDPVTGEVVKPADQSSIKFTFPKACEWFPQACEFIDWVRTDPEVESEMELPEKEIERHQIDDDLIKASGRSCPADITFDVDGLPFGITAPDSFKMQPVCDVLEPLKYVFVFMTTCLCAFLLVRF